MDKSFLRRRNRHLPKPPSGRLWRDLIIARPGEENVPTVAGASGRANLRASLRAAGAAKLPFTHKNTDNTFAE